MSSHAGGNVDIELDDLDALQYKQYKQRSRSQQLIYYGLQKTAKVRCSLVKPFVLCFHSIVVLDNQGFFINILRNVPFKV